MEVTPPPTVWNSIAADLDDSALSFVIASKLRNVEVTPPPTSLQHIFSALDYDNSQPAYAAALYNIEVAPPAAAWLAIKKNMDADAVPVVSMTNRSTPFIKYAAAAVVAGLLFWGGLQLFNGNKKNETATATVQPAAADATPQTTLPQASNIEEATATTDLAKEDAALEASKKIYASIDVDKAVKKVKKTYDPAIILPDVDPSISVGTRSLDIADTYETADDQLATQDKYIMLMTPDGKIIRMSKKFGDMVCCVSGEEQDENCVDQMSKWRKQIAEHPKALSPGNFLDILGLVNSLQED